jgi:hypothetical protein
MEEVMSLTLAGLDPSVRTELVNAAREFVEGSVSHPFSELERKALKPFFSNVDRKVFFVSGLPETVMTALLAMYSRLKNPRGLRGHFVDSMMPYLVAALSLETRKWSAKDLKKYLEGKGIATLDALADHRGGEVAFRSSLDYFLKKSPDPEFWEQLSFSERIREFLQMWLDIYGHNSIARTGRVILCCEDFSLLTVKTLEWGRPAAGEIELSTRYVNVSSKGQYPVWRELGILDHSLGERAAEMITLSMESYKDLMGDDFGGPFPEFLRQRWSAEVPSADLNTGVVGETCDVLGNLLPSSTLTSVGISMSAEAFPQHLKHLYLDGAPEGIALAEFIASEARRIGLGSFIRHEQPTPWEVSNWRYLEPRKESPSFQALRDKDARKVLADAFEQGPFADLFMRLQQIPRGNHDKLPSEFEAVTANIWGVMSLRGWRDWQRHTFCSHKRSRVTPKLGFYTYPKPAPPVLAAEFKRIHRENVQWYTKASESGRIPEALTEYPMALGNQVRYHSAGNLRQWEFCLWQRTNFSVNDEVRTAFLRADDALRNAYPGWWAELSRTNRIPRYIFARGSKGVPLP